MNSPLKRLFHFLGSLPFALCLISISALLVLMGTFIESRTESHLLAAHYTYAHPLFFLLLGAFFVNILFSALLRWPFQKKHVPFLLTHLGLLMILAGTMIKNRYGLQGQLFIWEGSGQQEVLLPHTHALYLEKKGKDFHSLIPALLPLKQFQENATFSPFPGLKCTIKGYAPHVKEELETWIKGSHAYLFGLPPLPVHCWDASEAVPEPLLIRLPSSPVLWNFLALKTSHVSEAVRHIYLKNLNLHLTSKKNRSHLLIIPLDEALNKPFTFAGGVIDVSLSLSETCVEKKEHCSIQLSCGQETLLIHLQGEKALYNQSVPSFFKPSFTADLERPHPFLCLIEDEEKNIFLFSFDSHGGIDGQIFDPTHLETLVAYHQGFGGYTLQARLSPSKSRKEKEESDKKNLQKELENIFAQDPPLSPPLCLFKRACEKVKSDFSSQLVDFLVQWEASPHFLFHPTTPLSPPLRQVLQALPWEEISSREKEALPWIQRLFDQLEQEHQKGNDLLAVLNNHHWPFLNELKQAVEEKGKEVLPSIVAQQLFSIASCLPSLSFPFPRSPEEHASLLSAYLKAYDMDYPSLHAGIHPTDDSSSDSEYLLETPLTTHILPDESPVRLEEQRPGLVLELEEAGKRQMIALAYDALKTGLKWPVLQGNYVIRFQPELENIPYRIRLKQARRLAYPDSPQIYSYESDLWFSEQGQPPLFQTLSMNQVYETWDGYRFYLASVGESADRSLKNIQLVINYDPVKYFLTYPGIGFVFLGTFLLFWKPSQKIIFSIIKR